MENCLRDLDRVRNIFYFFGFVDKVKYISLKKRKKWKGGGIFLLSLILVYFNYLINGKYFIKIYVYMYFWNNF